MAGDFTPDEKDLDLIQAVAAALSACNEAGELGDQVIARINLGPIDLHGSPEGYRYCHSADLTAAGLVEVLKMLGASPATVTPVDHRAMDIHNSPEDQAYFAAEHKGLADQMQKVFNEIDVRAMQKTALNNREVTMLAAVEAIDSVFGDLSDPLADEDDN
jgi:hypothetical protein